MKSKISFVIVLAVASLLLLKLNLESSKLSLKFFVRGGDAHRPHKKEMIFHDKIEQEDKSKQVQQVRDFAGSSENTKFFDRFAKKEKLVSVLKQDELSLVLRFLPATIHFEFSEEERVNILSSFCRFKIENEKSFELLKVFLNKTYGFRKKGSKLNQVCRERV